MNKIRHFLEEFGAAIQATAVPAEVRGHQPEELHFELTYRCNTACIMCNLRYLKSPERELTLEEIKEMIGRSSSLNDIRFIVLSGGEAWLRDDLSSIVRFLKERFKHANILILSNLSDTALALSRLQELQSSAGLDRLSIGSSLDGVGAAHDAIRGKTGSFEALARSLETLKKAYPSLFCSLNFTLMPENADQIAPAFRWCSENGYHLSFQVLVQKQETKRFSWDTERIAVADAQLDEIIGILGEQCGIRSGHELLGNEGLLSMMLGLHYMTKYIRTPERYFPNCPCGEKYAMIDPSGNLYFCPVHKNRIAGNIRHAGFDAAWQSKEAHAIRDFFNKRTCHCWLTCTYGHMIGTAIAAGKKQYIASSFTSPDK